MPRATPQGWASSARDVEAVVVRIGLNGAQLVLVDAEGAWERWVLGSPEEAVEVARSAGLEVHVGAYPDHLRLRMNRRRPEPSELAGAPYPEQGRVGPVLPYPENRPRRPAPAGPGPRPQTGV